MLGLNTRHLRERIMRLPSTWLTGTKGVHPEDHKQESLQMPIGGLIASEEFYIPTSDINGMPLKSNYKVGDKVLGGQLANQVRNNNERQYLIPTSGELVGMENILISGRVPYYSQCFKLVADGRNEMMPSGDDSDYHNCSQEEIINRVRNAAIYGMGGGGFPTWRKIMTGNIKHLIVNAVECEPYITVDQALVEAHSDAIISAISLLQELIKKYDVTDHNATDHNTKLITYIAIEDNMRSAIDKLRNSLSDSSLENTYVKIIRTVYPAGSEKQLVHSLLGQEIPVGQVAAQQGVLSLNIATVHAIYRSLIHRAPLLQRVVTVSGNGVSKPRNYWVRIGTPIKNIIKHVGVKDADKLQVYLGGGMMNYRVHDTNMPTSSSTNCILLFSDTSIKSHTGNGRGSGFSKSNGTGIPQLDGHIKNHRECIRCGLCEQVCPVNLLPQQLYRYIKADKFELAEQDKLSSCIECAACDYVCPSNIPLSEYYTFAKEHIKYEQQSNIRSDRARTRFNEHKERLEKDKLAQQQRREARRAAMNKVTTDSPVSEQETKQRKIASLKMQIDKTSQAISKWDAPQVDSQVDSPVDMEVDSKVDIKVKALRQVVEKLQQELHNLENTKNS